MVFRFRFPSFWFASVLPSLSSFGSLLLTASVFFFSSGPLLFCFFFLFIENKTEQVRLSCVPSITQRLVGHWGEFGGGGGEERDAGESSNFFVFCSVKTGGRRKMNSVVQNDTVLIFLFFFIYIYIYETASFWVKRAVSFKWLNFKSVPQIRSPPLLLAAFFTLVLGL